MSPVGQPQDNCAPLGNKEKEKGNLGVITRAQKQCAILYLLLAVEKTITVFFN